MKLSIITINYNNCEGLRRTIDSVMNQTWQDFEWIIVDGGSTDGSRELIEDTAVLLASQGWCTNQFSLLGFTADNWNKESFIESSSLISNSSSRRLLWCSESDKGVYNAMNKGIVKAIGDYLLFLNSGDCLADNSVFERVSNYGLEKDFCIGQLEVLSPSHTIVVILENQLCTKWFYRGTLPHQSTFIKRDIFQMFGFYDEDYKIVSDRKLFAEAIGIHGSKFKTLPFVVSVYEGGGISDTNSSLFHIERSKMVYDCFLERMEEDYALAQSLRMVRSNAFCRRIYSLLYRIAYKLLK